MYRLHSILSFISTAAMILATEMTFAVDSAADPITYSTHIRKVFRDHCHHCHNASRQRAGLDLSSYSATLDGSSSGEIVIPGEPEESLLFLSMIHAEEPSMPPGKAPLRTSILDQVNVWIATGLPETPEDVDEAAASVVEKHRNKLPDQSGISKTSSQSVNPDLVFVGAHGNPVTSLAVSPTGSMAAVGGQLQVLLFDLTSGEYTGALAYPEGEVFSLRFSADGESLLAGGGTAAETGRVVIWSTRTLQRTHVVGDEYDVVLGADMSPDGSLVLYGGPDRMIRLANLASRRIVGEIKKHTDWLTAASFSPEGLIFTTADRDGNAYVWETQSQDLLHTLRGHSGSITAIQWTADGNHCVTSAEDGTVRVWDMHTGEATREWMAHKDGTLAMEVSSTNEVVSAGRDGFVRRWSLDGTKLSEITSEAMPTQVSIAGGTMIVGDWDGNLSLWKPGRDELIALAVPESKSTSDPEPLLAEVSGPDPIQEVEITSVAALSSSEMSVAEASIADSQPISNASADPGTRLARAEATLSRILQQLERRDVSRTGANTTSLLRALSEATQIAREIEQPSSEMVEVQVFLKAAMERARSTVSTEMQSTGIRNAMSNSELRAQLQSVTTDLVAITKQCQSIQSEYQGLDSQVKTLTTQSSLLKTKYVNVAEQLRQLAKLSSELDQQLTTIHFLPSDSQTAASH